MERQKYRYYQKPLIVEGESDVVHCNTAAVTEALLLISLVLPLSFPHFREDSETDSFELQAHKTFLNTCWDFCHEILTFFF